MWEETSAPEENTQDTETARKLHTEKPQSAGRFKPENLYNKTFTFF